MIILRVDSFATYAYSRRNLPAGIFYCFLFSQKYFANESTLNIDISRDYCAFSQLKAKTSNM